MKLTGKVAIVTGGAGAIGAAIGKALADEGARVVLADLSAEKAERAAAEIGTLAHGVAFDCTSQTSIDRLVAECVGRAGGIDILVNAAGLFSAAALEDLSREDWLRLIAVNVEGTLFTMQAVARQMISRRRGGKIVNIASMSGRRGAPLTPAYCATKAAVISLTQSAGLGLVRHGINVNAIAPGEVDTPMWDEADRCFSALTGAPPGQTKRQATAAVPAGRMASPRDIAGVAVFLASPEADYIVGQTFGVDGGVWLA